MSVSEKNYSSIVCLNNYNNDDNGDGDDNIAGVLAERNSNQPTKRSDGNRSKRGGVALTTGLIFTGLDAVSALEGNNSIGRTILVKIENSAPSRAAIITCLIDSLTESGSYTSWKAYDFHVVFDDLR